MSTRSVLVSGASIAGPAVAHWLHRHGFDVTVVEKAPALRPGGQAVDFKGPVHRAVLERTGILEQVRAAQTGGDDGTIVDACGRRLATVPKEFSAGELEIARGDLAAILHTLTEDTCEYVFGDAAYGNTLGGYGTGLALVGAYVLAGELGRRAGRAGADHTTAFAAYETMLRRYARGSGEVNAGRLLAPRTRLGMRARNAMFSVAALTSPLLRLTERGATRIDLPDYATT